MNKLYLYISLVLFSVFLGVVNASQECHGEDGCFENIIENEDETTVLPYPTYTLPPPPTPPPPPPPPCPAMCLFSGVFDFPHFTTCNRFYRCIHGFFFDMSCPAGEEFDHAMLRCVDDDAADCILNHDFHGN